MSTGEPIARDATAGDSSRASGGGSPDRRRVRAINALVAGVALAAAAVLAGQATEIPVWSRSDWVAAAVLAVATVVVELFPLHLRHGTETESFSVGDAVWTAGLMLSLPSVLILAVAVGALTAQLWRRQPLRKAAFNVGQFTLAVWAATLVYGSHGSADPSHPANWVLALLAIACYFCVNEALVSLVISLAEGERFRDVVLGSFGLGFLQLIGNCALGIMAAVLWDIRPADAVLVAAPLALSYLAYAGWLNSRRERERMSRLYEAGQVLLDRLETEGDFGPFLEHVARMMEAPEVRLALSEPGQQFVFTAGAGVEILAFVPPAADAGPNAWLDASTSGHASVVFVGMAGEPEGALAVIRTTPLTPTERSLLESLADQVWVKLRHTRLFAEAERRRAQLAEIFASASDGIFVCTSAGRVAAWNPAMADITGVASDRAVGRSLRDLLVAADGDGPVWDPAAAGSGTATRPLVRTDGAIRWVTLSWNRLGATQDPGGDGFVVVGRDVSAELEAERAKTDIVAAVSHELRTPLTPLKGYLTMFANGAFDPTDPGSREYFDMMLRQVDRLERLIVDLLDASQLDAGGMEIAEGTTDLSAMIDERAGNLRQREPGREVRVDVPPRSATVRADPARVRQILDHLLSNALKYSPPGSLVELRVRIEDRRCVVAVRDHGPGIAPADQRLVFDRFHKLDNRSTRTTGGAGLGLFLAKQLVEAMSGRMWVESSPGHGSTFLFSLPLAATDEPASVSTPSAGSPTTAPARHPDAGPNIPQSIAGRR
jgi:PAS domain S-box-containing protein